MAPLTTEQVIAGLDEVWTSILEATDGLKESAWSLPTDCPGWDVSDQVAHIIGVELLLLGEPTPEIEIGERDYLKNDFGVSLEPWIEVRRPLPGKAVRNELAEVAQRRLAALRALDEPAFDAVGWSPIGQVPMRVFMEVRIMDCWVHEQDIRIALGRPGGRFSVGEATALDRADAALGGIIGRGVRAPEGTSVALEITGPQGGRRRLEVVGGRAVWQEGLAATVTLTMSQETYVRRFAGRISADEARIAEGTGLVGDLEIGLAVLEALGVMI